MTITTQEIDCENIKPKDCLIRLPKLRMTARNKEILKNKYFPSAVKSYKNTYEKQEVFLDKNDNVVAFVKNRFNEQTIVCI
tara:strand:- start:46 stop:288 length:243 start_codon:yes stop_codon:yes gene_type:complete